MAQTVRHIRRTTLYASRADVFRLVVIADTHLGNIASDERALKAICADVAQDDQAFWLGLGDYCEFINMRDPRFSVDSLPGWLFGREELRDIARTEVDRFLSYTRPIAGKCIGLCEGNHEASILQHSECDVYSRIVEGLASADEHRLDHRGMVSWQFNRGGGGSWTVRLFASHGSVGGRAETAPTAALVRLADQVDGIDAVLMGHLHRYEHHPVAKLRPDAGKVRAVTTHLVSAPALCGEMEYAERKDLRRAPLGWVELLIEPDAKRVDVRAHII